VENIQLGCKLVTNTVASKDVKIEGALYTETKTMMTTKIGPELTADTAAEIIVASPQWILRNVTKLHDVEVKLPQGCNHVMSTVALKDAVGVVVRATQITVTTKMKNAAEEVIVVEDLRRWILKNNVKSHLEEGVLVQGAVAEIRSIKHDI